MNVDMAKRLADRRRQAGYTQEALAEKLDVSRQAVSKWERSESSPDTDNLIALAELYGVSLDELLYEDVNTAAATDLEAAPDIADGTEDAGHANNGEGENDDAAAQESASPTPEESRGHRSDDGTVQIGPDGIHVENEKDYVHINWHDGVNVISGETGDKVHVGWDGVHVNDDYYDNLEDANEALGVFRHGEKSRFHKAWIRFPFPLVVILVYVLAGAFAGTWGMGLFMFATIPLYYLLGTLIDTHRLGRFLAGVYPWFSVVWFCYMAFVRNEPHPAWVIFLTIPLAEWLIFVYARAWRRRKRNAKDDR